MAADNFKRFRFSVPNEDESVIAWINAQNNLSFSIRCLIKEYVRDNGQVDITCTAPTRRRGRPTNAELEARQKWEQENEAARAADMQEPVQENYARPVPGEDTRQTAPQQTRPAGPPVKQEPPVQQPTNTHGTFVNPLADDDDDDGGTLTLRGMKY